MALRPCTLCFKRYRGPSYSAYIAIVDGGERWEHKPKLCPADGEKLEQLFRDVNGLIEYDSIPNEMPLICLVCHDQVDGKHPQSVFMTVYPPREERRDFFASVCSACRPGAEIALRGRWKG